MRFEFQTLDCSHLGYAALQNIFHDENSDDLKVLHINMKQFISVKPSKLLTYLVKLKYNKSDDGIIVIMLWWKLNLEKLVFFHNSSVPDSQKMKLQMLSRETGTSPMHSFCAEQGWDLE